MSRRIEVASATPGRTRLRLPSSQRDPEHVERVAEHIARRPDVERVRTNHRTGSVLVSHADDRTLDDRILEDLDEISNVLSFGMGGTEVGNIANQLGETISRLNQRIYEATGENYHLGTLVPGAMAVVGVWQTVRTGLGFELIPGPLMLWLAWDLYRSFGADPGAN